MCSLCDQKKDGHQAAALRSPARRQWLSVTGAATLVGLLSGACSVVGAHGIAPKPENVLSAEAALARLMAGNDRYVSGHDMRFNDADTRVALVQGQNPFACVVSCADSRIDPERCFNTGRGDLFVTRVAGNFVNTDILASLEYGTAVLEAPLVMVLGHTNCGAVGAAVKAYTEHVSFPGHIQHLATEIAPAVRAVAGSTPASELVQAATAENVRLNVKKLQESNPILSARVAQGKLKVVGAIYDLSTGRVTLL